MPQDGILPLLLHDCNSFQCSASSQLQKKLVAMLFLSLHVSYCTENFQELNISLVSINFWQTCLKQAKCQYIKMSNALAALVSKGPSRSFWKLPCLKPFWTTYIIWLPKDADRDWTSDLFDNGPDFFSVGPLPPLSIQIGGPQSPWSPSFVVWFLKRRHCFWLFRHSNQKIL